MISLISQSELPQQIIGTLEKQLQYLGTLNGPLEEKVKAVAVEFLKSKAMEVDNNAKGIQELCVSRLSQHSEDVLYLIQKRISLGEIIKLLCQQDYENEWGSLFKEEKSLLRIQNCHAQSMYMAYCQWLAQNTTYGSIMSKLEVDQGRVLYNKPGFKFHLTSSFVMKVFYEAARVLGDPKQNAKVLQVKADNPTTSFVIYRERGSRFNLLFWQQDERRFFLGQGAHNTVWKVIDLAKGCFLALKHPRNSADPAASGMHAFGLELRAWNILKINRVGISDSPEALVVDKDVLALVSKCYEGDAIDFLERLKLEALSRNDLQASSPSNEYATLTVKQVLAGFLNALRGVQTLSDLKICHRDIKQENLFFDFSGEDRQLKFVIADFGFAETYDNIINNKEWYGSYPVISNKNDIACLIRLFKTNPIKREAIEALLEKREVLAFGMTMFRTFLHRDMQDSVFLTIEEKNRFLSCFGEQVYSVMQYLVAEDYRQRPSVGEAIGAMESILNVPYEGDGLLNQTFQKALFSFKSRNNSLAP